MKRQNEINYRNDYIKSLNGFLISAKSFLGETLQKLNWTESATVVKNNEKPLVICPLDSGHRIAGDNIDKHIELCRWHQMGYRDDDLPFPSPPKRLPVSSVVIDKNLQKEIIMKAAEKDPSIKIGKNVDDREVPQTSDRFFTDFTTDERRILYNYVVSKTADVMPQLKEFSITMKPESQSAPMTREQLMAAERDAKRRRIKHRSAKVHTKSKNYSEVLREVIKNQMEGYEDWVRENFGNSVDPEYAEQEKNNTEEVKQEKEEMVWLDWGFRGNPHTQWKQVLEKERRRKESEKKEEKDLKRSGNDHEKDRDRNIHERKRGREERSSGRYHHKEEFRKYGHDDKRRRDKYDHETYSERRRIESEKEGNNRRNDSFRKESHHSRHRGEKYEEEHLRSERDRRDRYENQYKSKYKEKKESKNEDEYKSNYKEKHESKNNPIAQGSERRLEYYRDESSDKSSIKCDKYDGYYEMERGIRTKEESVEDSEDRSYLCSNKSYDRVRREKEGESTESDSESDSSHSSRDSKSRDSRRVKKRKKSKKKHKHRHKKKHRKEHS